MICIDLCSNKAEEMIGKLVRGLLENDGRGVGVGVKGEWSSCEYVRTHVVLLGRFEVTAHACTDNIRVHSFILHGA